MVCERRVVAVYYLHVHGINHERYGDVGEPEIGVALCLVHVRLIQG